MDKPETKAEEQHRVDAVIKTISDQVKQTEKQLEKAHQETRRVERNYSQNAKINTDEVDDRMETNAAVQQQKQLVAKTVEDESILNRQLNILTHLEQTPYFGRIDIVDPGETESESLYIGTGTVTDDDGNFLVYDWRAPISSIYYNGTLGKVNYTTPAGEQTTDLVKKRQFTIEAGKITNMFDTNETVGDEMLQAVLGGASDEHMKNIVATIQAEQNDIIRNTRSDLLIVQGVAGSGKTSTILQRIAFLLYHSRDKLSANQIILFSPNTLFSNYISEVLPSLGENNMRQVTLYNFYAQRLHGLHITSLFDHYEATTNQPAAAREQKSTQQFMQQLHDYVADLTLDQIRFTPVNLQTATEQRVFFTKDHIKTVFGKFLTAAPTAKAQTYRQTQNELIKQLNARIKQDATSSAIQEQLDNLSGEQLQALRLQVPGIEHLSYSDQRFQLGRKLTAQAYTGIYDALYNDYFIDYASQYADFLKRVLGDTAKQEFLNRLERHQLAFDDCAPLLYLRDLITGGGQNPAIAHLFIDEMQDYSLASLAYLRHAFPKAKFTLLGDRMQALYHEALPEDVWLQQLKTDLAAKHPQSVSLKKSYRSSFEIADFMRFLLPDPDSLEPFNRHERQPNLIVAADKTAAVHQIAALLAASDATSKVAIITKSAAQAAQLHRTLQRDYHCDCALITQKTPTLPHGSVIVPIYLAKGLEFDHVIAYDTSKKTYHSKHDAEILYTVCSRALHRLDLLAISEVSPLITKIAAGRCTLQAELALKN